VHACLHHRPDDLFSGLLCHGFASHIVGQPRLLACVALLAGCGWFGLRGFASGWWVWLSGGGGGGGSCWCLLC
jgi:hypothetical protein